MHKKLLLLVLLSSLNFIKLKAQDPQFSQFYAAPLYLNPAFAGSNQASRAIANYRNQWPNFQANFITYAASFDHFFRKYNSGIGILAMADQEGIAGYQSYSVSAQYAYQLQLSKKFTLRPGLQASFSNRRIGLSRLIFPEQVTDDGIIPGGPLGPVIDKPGSTFFDVSAGGVLYSSKFWIGFATHHLNQPNQSAIGGTNRLPIKASVHAGYKIPLRINEFPKKWRSGQRIKRGFENEERDISITPVLNYKHQGPFDQMDAGIYFNYDPMVFGFWYRGIPLKNPAKNGGFNNDALIFLLGLRIMDLHVGYSYDLTISKLSPRTGGSHELSIIYDFYLGYRNQKAKTPPKNVRRMPCPDF